MKIKKNDNNIILLNTYNGYRLKIGGDPYNLHIKNNKITLNIQYRNEVYKFTIYNNKNGFNIKPKPINRLKRFFIEF